MRGLPEHNFAAFREVEAELRDYLNATNETFMIHNPAGNFGGDQTLLPEAYMHADLCDVLDADVVVLLPGWGQSEGSKLEVRVGQATGKRFMLAERLDFGNDPIEGPGVSYHFRPLHELPAVDASPRASALDEARALITGDRNNAYGPPMQDHARAAAILNAQGYRALNGRLLEPHDISIMVIGIKLSRLVWSPRKRDHWVDIAGYAGCGYECASEAA